MTVITPLKLKKQDLPKAVGTTSASLNKQAQCQRGCAAARY